MTRQFYDGLAPLYHLIFADWDASVTRQATILDRLIRRVWSDSVTSVLDVACGIGTQALGLAQLGYNVTASDLSPEMVARTNHEATQRGLAIDASVADMRQADTHHRQIFDVVIACDNAVPHLLSDADILKAFRAFYRCVKPGGGCLITVRDYDAVERSGMRVIPYGTREEDGVTYFIFQVWTFDDACYDLAMCFVRDDRAPEDAAHIFWSRYYAVSPARLEALLREAGFGDVRRAESDYYQPVIVGCKQRPAAVPSG
jgi:SAM-dependent methyltransferase